jgi:predicted RNA methylase
VCAVDLPPQKSAAGPHELERWAERQRRRDERWLAVLSRRAVRAYRFARAPGGADLLFERLANSVLDRGGNFSGGVDSSTERVFTLPSAWHVLPRALRYTGVSDRDTFVDFGCGKGRVVHQAAKRPFHRVIGVEISPDLVEAARNGLAALAHQHKCKSVEIVRSDVVQFQVPDDLTIAYFFRPFGDQALESVLRRLVESIDRRPRRVRLIYVSPTDGTRSMILRTDRFRLAQELPGTLTKRRSQPVAIFESG